jgi:hypothetical protein
MHMHHPFLIGLPSIAIAAFLGLAVIFFGGLLIMILRWLPHHGLFVLVMLGIGFVAFSSFRHRAVHTEMIDAEPHARNAEQRAWDVKVGDRRESAPAPPAPTPTDAAIAPAAQGVDNTSSTAILPTNPAPTPRPAWVGQSPHLEQRDGQEIYFDSLTIGPYSTIAECDREMLPAVNRSVHTYAEGHFPGGDEITLDSQFIETHLIQARWRETLTTSLGPMQQLHLLLAFDRTARNEIENRARQVIVAQRLNSAAGGAAAVLLFVGGIYSLLRWGPRRRPRSFEA